MILDVEATPTRISKEVDAAESMLQRTGERFALKPDHVAGDVAYGTGELLGWLVEREIDPHIPVWDKSQRTDGSFSTADFAYDEAQDIYICPSGHPLTTTGHKYRGTRLHYLASVFDCRQCPLKQRCCPKAPQRRLNVDVNERARNHVRSLMQGEAYARSRGERKKIETLFGEAKRHLGLERLRLRGLTGAHDEFLLVATVQNLKRLIRRVAIPPPAGPVAA